MRPCGGALARAAGRGARRRRRSRRVDDRCARRGSPECSLRARPRGSSRGDAFRRTSHAWRAILRGDSEDFSACGPRMLDEWAADLVARLVAAPSRTEQLRRQLRERGVAAFGLVMAASDVRARLRERLSRRKAELPTQDAVPALLGSPIPRRNDMLSTRKAELSPRSAMLSTRKAELSPRLAVPSTRGTRFPRIAMLSTRRGRSYRRERRMLPTRKAELSPRSAICFHRGTRSYPPRGTPCLPRGKADPSRAARRPRAPASTRGDGYVDPRRRHVDPRRRHVDPRRRHVDPRRRHVDPRRRHVDPRGKHVAPRGKHVAHAADHPVRRGKEHAVLPWKARRPILDATGCRVRGATSSIGSSSPAWACLEEPSAQHTMLSTWDAPLRPRQREPGACVLHPAELTRENRVAPEPHGCATFTPRAFT